MSSCDVVVVGGGPAGATAARHLALAGYSVRLLEAEPLPRYKTCGGGLVLRARRWLEVDLAGVIESECHRAEMRFLEHGLCFRVESDQPVVTMTMRADLDLKLVRAAESAGARVVTPCRVLGLRSDTDGVQLATDRGPLSAAFVIAADGAAGRVARFAGWRRQPPRAPALESEIEVSAGTLGTYHDRAVFDFGVIPRGYAWIFPKRGHLSVGCLSTRSGERDLRRYLEAYLARLGIEPRRRQDHGFTIPLAPRTWSLARDRVLLTGDAAGLADPVTCEGISHAVVSGRLAADAVADHFQRPRIVGREYQRRLAKKVLGELATARLVARLLYGAPATANLIFRRAGSPLCRAVGEIFAGRETYQSLLTRPGNYLRLLRRMLAA